MDMKYGISVYIRDKDYSRGKNIWILHRRPDGIRYIAKPVQLIFEKEPEDGLMVDPTLSLSESVADEFLKAFAEVLDKKGIKTENDFKIQGLLEAKEAHLQDMRSIVFDGKDKT